MLLWRDLAIGAASSIAIGGLLLLVVVLPVAMWGQKDSIEFYGAFFGSMLSAAAAVVAVIVSARQTENVEREKEKRAKREQLSSIARLAHSELIGTALAIQNFGRSLAAAQVRGATPQQFCALLETWTTLANTPTVDKFVFDLCKIGPKPAAVLSTCLHARANFVALLKVWQDKAEQGHTLSPEHVAALHRLCQPLPLTFFAAAHQIKEHAASDAAWSDLDPETSRRIRTEWTEYQRSIGLEPEPQPEGRIVKTERPIP